MDSQAIQDALLGAEQLASGVTERFQVAAFKIAARELLRDTFAPAAPFDPEVNRQSAVEEFLPQTVNELLAMLSKRSNPDRFEALVLFALRREDMDGVGTDYIASSYTKGRVPKPANMADVIAACARRGHLMDGERRDGKKTWTLTTKGERYVDAMLAEVVGE